MLGISCVTQGQMSVNGQMSSNKCQRQEGHEYKVSWQSIQAVDIFHFEPKQTAKKVKYKTDKTNGGMCIVRSKEDGFFFALVWKICY